MLFSYWQDSLMIFRMSFRIFHYVLSDDNQRKKKINNRRSWMTIQRNNLAYDPCRKDNYNYPSLFLFRRYYCCSHYCCCYCYYYYLYWWPSDKAHRVSMIRGKKHGKIVICIKVLAWTWIKWNIYTKVSCLFPFLFRPFLRYFPDLPSAIIEPCLINSYLKMWFIEREP